MRAIVLVGGEGTRLRPLTLRTSKALIPVLHRPLLEHLLRHLRAHDVREVTLALTRTPGSEAVRDRFGDGAALGLALRHAYEQTPLGSGGAIAAAAAGWREPFLVCNGDLITDLDLTAMAAAHRARGAALSIALFEVDDPSGFGVVAMDPAGRITRFVEKPPRAAAPSRLINAGAWLFEPELLAEMDATRFHRVEEGLFPALAAAGRAIYGFPHHGTWIDAGTPAAYLRANAILLGGAIPAALPDGWPAIGVMTAGAIVQPGAHIAAPALVGAGSVLRAGATLRGPVTLGPRCTVEAGAVIERSVLWDGVTVGRDSVVRDCILASGVRVGAGAVLEDAVVGHEAVIGAGERPAAGARIEPGRGALAATP